MAYLRARALCSKTKAICLVMKQCPTALSDFLRSMNQTSEEGNQCIADFACGAKWLSRQVAIRQYAVSLITMTGERRGQANSAPILNSR